MAVGACGRTPLQGFGNQFDIFNLLERAMTKVRYNPEVHHRRSVRLKNYDYSQSGAYFVTICTHQREHLFGQIQNEEMTLNHCGTIVVNEWLKSEEIREEIILDAWVVMPNHFHGIVFIENDSSLKIEKFGHPKGLGIHPKARSLSTLIGAFKAAVTKQINIFRNTPGIPVWQRNYHEAIVRDQKMLHHLRGYIENNPRSWTVDCLYQP